MTRGMTQQEKTAPIAYAMHSPHDRPTCRLPPASTEVTMSLFCVVLLLLLGTLGISAELTKRQHIGSCQKEESCDNISKETYSFNRTCSSIHSDPGAKAINSIHSSIVKADCELASPNSYPAHYSPYNWEEFDFIVVGAGSAGAVVANRLTEESGWRVLLLEAGTNPTKTSEIPAMLAQLQQSEEDWQYQTEPSENYCLGMEGNKCNWPRGKVLGGSSTLNFMNYVRGNPKDYDSWAERGNTGWGYDDILPYFKKSEDMTAEEVLNTTEFSKYHGTGGYLKIETWQSDDIQPMADAFAAGMEELGYHFNPDGNSGNQTGFVKLQGTLKDGRRCSTAKAFLTPIIHRQNLKVSKQSHVSRILINENLKTAYGVEFFNKDGHIVKVKAKKEVILSAGSINTPQLLMLSGIGPRKHLEDFNIKVIEDLPVGKNLQDHLSTIGYVISLNFTKSSESPEESMINFLLKRKSRYSGVGISAYAGFISTVKDEVNYPDIEMLLLDLAKNDMAGWSGVLKMLGVREEIKNSYFEIGSKSHTIIPFASLLRPYSRGRIELKSSDARESPKMTAGYFSDNRDLETFIRYLDLLNRLVQTEGFKKLDAQLHKIQIPACSEFSTDSREDKECTLRYLTTTTYHQCCTAKMGPASSADSVVDPNLRVIGIKGLRVMDASILPSQVSGNLNAPVIMIAEKGSDLIKKSY